MITLRNYAPKNSLPVNSTSTPLPTFVNTITNRFATLTFAENANDGDTISIASKKFTYESSNTGIPDRILIQNSKEDTALATLLALQKSDSVDTQQFGWTIGIPNTVIMATQLAVSNQALDTTIISSSSHPGRINTDFGPPGYELCNTEAFSLAGNGLLGQLGSLSFVRIDEGPGVAALWQKYSTGAQFRKYIDSQSVSRVDALIKCTFRIGQDQYNGYIIQQLAGSLIGIDDTMYCINESYDSQTPGSLPQSQYNGKVFTINFQAAQVFRTALAITSFIEAWNIDSKFITFKQNNYIKINNKPEDITVDELTCGGIYGMTALLQTDNFINLEVITP